MPHSGLQQTRRRVRSGKNNQVYMFYNGPNNSNADCLEHLMAHIKLIEAHNVSVGYHLGLAVVVIK